MAYLLDTNFISETIRPNPDAWVKTWVFGKYQSELYLSVVSIAEIRRGIEQLGPGRRRTTLEIWLSHDLPQWFSDHMLPITAEIADECGRLLAHSRRHGLNLEAMDALIAATAQVHDLTLATLNRKHFAKLGVKLLELS